MAEASMWNLEVRGAMDILGAYGLEATEDVEAVSAALWPNINIYEFTSEMTDIPGDTTSTETIAVGETKTSDLQPSLDRDWFGFSSQAGDVIGFTLTGDMPEQMRLRIYDANGVNVDSYDTYLAGDGERFMALDTEVTGDYFINVEAYFTSADTWNYALTATAIADDYAGHLGTSGVLGLDGTPVSGNIDYAEDFDWLSFTVSAGDQYDFSMTAGSLPNQRIALIDPNGNFVLNNAAGFTHFFTEGGTYFIQTHAADFISIGSYSVTAMASADIVGTSGGDVLFGTSAGETIMGLGGNDTINASGGNDTISGGDGDDILNGNFGVDTIYGGDGRDVIEGQAGTDVLFGGAGNDVFIIGNSHFSDDISGGAGRDTLDVSSRTDEKLTLDLEAGIYELHGPTPSSTNTISGVEIILATQLNDVISTGNSGLIRVDGGGGNDQITGGNGKQVLNGGAGIDTLEGGAGADILNGGAGNDAASYELSGAGVTVNLTTGTGLGGHAEGDSLTGIENIFASDFDDVLTGTNEDNAFFGEAGNDTIDALGGDDFLDGDSGDDILTGGAGDDSLNGGEGADTINGGDGIDTASYSGSSQGVIVNLLNGNTARGDAAGDVISGIESLVGSRVDDILIGSHAANRLNGNSGNDILFGRGGDDELVGGFGDDNLQGGGASDVLNGGRGDDMLTGGAGRDSFVFTSNFGQDIITDFQDNFDSIDFSAHSNFNSIADVLAAAVQIGANVQIDLNVNNVLILEVFDLTDLDASDFIF